MGQRMLGQLRKEPDFPIEHGPHAVGHMLLVRAMDRHAFPAAAMVAAGLPAGAVIPLRILRSELSDERLLEGKPLCPVPRRKAAIASFSFSLSSILIVNPSPFTGRH